MDFIYSVLDVRRTTKPGEGSGELHLPKSLSAGIPLAAIVAGLEGQGVVEKGRDINGWESWGNSFSACILGLVGPAAV